MNRLLLVLCAVTAVASAVQVSAATLLWANLLAENTAQFTYSVDQIVADGAGGCVVAIWRHDNNLNEDAVIVARFDIKGTARWSKIYLDTYDAEISYVDKKVTVFSLLPVSGDETVAVVDRAGTEQMIAEANTDVYCNPNSEIGPTADKKGFFVIARDASGASVLRRYSYK